MQYICSECLFSGRHGVKFGVNEDGVFSRGEKVCPTAIANDGGE